ncbi:hypothetical protein SmJEL517_g05725 [Synchytrium microbalum]|uniref:Sulfatase N-terminal domain-containing protein n=1 Tax=Synchytrium microbalum TaxID=1806994 RepID=A0A507BU09_9FUNG|nr:uncharacterized protein SmJEL517_g05725 [Synchytrium microbalum]TPX30798.1 hypothetical protein SmJEL517_g05725 [Synchytrium microbalum]
MTKGQPNFLVIIVDDMGFSDLTSFGGEIDTPNLDKLANDGIRLTGYHTASTCSPTRSMIFSGTDNHIAGLGQMREFLERNGAPFAGKAGYEGYLNFQVAALPEILQDHGYFTALSGKWHLGLTKDTSPFARGFEKVFTLLPGAGNHYAYEPQFEQKARPEGAVPHQIYMEDDKFIDLADLPENFYSTTTFTDKMLEFWKQQKESGDSRPFLSFMTYTAPHWPIQAPAEVIAKYKGRYDAGPDVIRAERLERLKKLGLVPKDVVAHPIVNLLGTKPWDELTDEQRKISARIMETYAAMVDIVDQNVGRLVDYLRETGELDNTFILFQSDNGAEGVTMEAFATMGLDVGKVIRSYYDQSYDNIGQKNSYHAYGPRWAQAATAPSRMFKAWVTEGGIRVPCIIHYPTLFKQPTISHEFSTCMDLLPTILDLAGVPHPGKVFRGRQVYEPRGKSLVPYLTGNAPRVHDKESTHGWELFGMQAIRKGDWKAILIPQRDADPTWELYNLESDPAELNDLALKEPATLKSLVAYWTAYADETGTVSAGTIRLHDAWTEGHPVSNDEKRPRPPLIVTNEPLGFWLKGAHQVTILKTPFRLEPHFASDLMDIATCYHVLGDAVGAKAWIISHVSKSLNYTAYDVKWVPMSARFVVLGQHSRGTGCLQVMEIDQGQIKLTHEAEKPTALKCATFGASSLNQRHIAIGDYGGRMCCYDLEHTDLPVYAVKAHDELVNCIDGCGGGSSVNSGPPEIVTASRDGAVKIWDVRQKDKPVATMAPAKGDATRDVWTVAFGNSYNDDERVVAAGYENGDVKLFDLRTMTTLWETNVKNGVVSIEFDRKDVKMNKMVVSGLEAAFHVYDLRTQHPTEGFASVSEKLSDDSTIWTVKHLPQDRDVFVTSGGGGSLHLWKYGYPNQRSKKDKEDKYNVGVAGTIEALNHSKVAEQPVNAFDWSPDKKGLCVFTAFDQMVRVGVVTKL